MKLYLQDLLSSSIIDVLDKNEIQSDVFEQGGEYVAELTFYTCHDGEQVTPVFFSKENSDEDFCNSLNNFYEDFDVDDYVTMWLEAKLHRTNVCPLSARQLVEDGEYIDNKLKTISEEVCRAIYG